MNITDKVKDQKYSLCLMWEWKEWEKFVERHIPHHGVCSWCLGLWGWAGVGEEREEWSKGQVVASRNMIVVKNS